MENGKTVAPEEFREINCDEINCGEKSPFEEMTPIPTQSSDRFGEAQPGIFPSVRKNRAVAALSVAAAIMIAASLAVHTVLALGAYKACRRGGADFLLATVFPQMHTEKGETSEKDGKRGGEKDTSGASLSGGKEDGAKENGEGGESTLHGESPYINCDLSSKAENGLALMNETSYEPDLSALFSREKPLPSAKELFDEYGADAPLVLIYHTHGTEAYSECADSGFRSDDITKNVVAVGTELARSLEKNGIKALHLTEMFDSGDFSTAYDRSTQAVRRIMEEYPSVRYVLDIHRDYVDRDGDYVRCASVSNEKSYAQLMFVCGTDEGGSGHTGWQDNLTVALQMQARLWQKNNNLMRAVDLKSASFYQDTSAGALIVEFGCCGNTLADAKASAAVFADALGEYIFG